MKQLLLLSFIPFTLEANSNHFDCSSRSKLTLTNFIPIYKDKLQNLSGLWGQENIEFLSDNSVRFFMRVHYPKGSIDPKSGLSGVAPLGGSGFKDPIIYGGTNCAFLTYKLKFSKNFDWALGGKLPGLYGGEGNSGGNIPNGFDGFSTRYMWKEDGRLSLYAYLPNSKTWGTSFGNTEKLLKAGKVHSLKQQVVLNQPGINNGIIRVWVDNKLITEKKDITFRNTPELKLDGLMFSTFFGGSSLRYASKIDSYIDFFDIRISY